MDNVLLKNHKRRDCVIINSKKKGCGIYVTRKSLELREISGASMVKVYLRIFYIFYSMGSR